jgi:prepilin-type N-terminal cleavage/methylation domain-containing protein
MTTGEARGTPEVSSAPFPTSWSLPGGPRPPEWIPLRGRLTGGRSLPRGAVGKTRRGLTLLELLLGLALGAILAGVGVLQSARLLASMRLPLGARQLASDLSLARATAVLRNTQARVTFDNNRYTVRFDAGEPSEVETVMQPGVRVARVPRSGMLRFFPTGRADNGTVVLTTSLGGSRSVVINQRGRVVVR